MFFISRNFSGRNIYVITALVRDPEEEDFLEAVLSGKEKEPVEETAPDVLRLTAFQTISRAIIGLECQLVSSRRTQRIWSCSG